MITFTFRNCSVGAIQRMGGGRAWNQAKKAQEKSGREFGDRQEGRDRGSRQMWDHWDLLMD